MKVTSVRFCADPLELRRRDEVTGGRHVYLTRREPQE